MKELQEITARDLQKKMQAGEKFFIVDVREEWELGLARLADERVIHVPMSRIGQLYRDAFPETLAQPESEIVVMCHHGVRSANVAMWMLENGWQNIYSLMGGIDAYAQDVDPSVGEY